MKQHSTKVLRDIINTLGSFIQTLFITPNAGNPTLVSVPAGQCKPPRLPAQHIYCFLYNLVCVTLLLGPLRIILLRFSVLAGSTESQTQMVVLCSYFSGSSGAGGQGGPGVAGMSGGLSTQAAFEYHGVWIPLVTVSMQSCAKAI